MTCYGQNSSLVGRRDGRGKCGRRDGELGGHLCPTWVTAVCPQACRRRKRFEVKRFRVRGRLLDVFCGPPPMLRAPYDLGWDLLATLLKDTHPEAHNPGHPNLSSFISKCRTTSSNLGNPPFWAIKNTTSYHRLTSFLCR